MVVSACATGDGDEPIEPFLDSNKADGNAPKLKKVDRHKLHVDEPSDLTLVDDQLYVVSDQHSQDLRASRATATSRTRSTSTAPTSRRWPSTRARRVPDRRRDQRARSGTSTPTARAAIRSTSTPTTATAASRASPSTTDGHLFVAKEKDPARIFELDPDGVEIDREKIDFAADLSALAFNPEDGRLYALSDQERALYRLDDNFDADFAWRVPVDKPEGLAFDGGRIFIASDSEERIYEFELE